MSGTTVDLVRNGWELSLVDSPDPRAYRGRAFYFYGNHAGLGLQMKSAAMFIEDQIHFDQWVACVRTPILVEHVAREIRIMVPKANSSVTNWDGAISLKREIFDDVHVKYGSHIGGITTMHTMALHHYARFLSVNSESDIFVPKEELWTVEKHLNAIREMQEPKQAELRRKILDSRERGKDSTEIKTRIALVS